MSQFISQMHLRYGSKLLFLPKDKTHALRADVSHSLQESQTDVGCPPELSSFSLSSFPISEGNIYLTFTWFILFFFCIHFSHSFSAPIWSLVVIQMLLSGEQRWGPFPWRIYRAIWLAGPGWWLQVSVRTAWVRRGCVNWDRNSKKKPIVAGAETKRFKRQWQRF